MSLQDLRSVDVYFTFSNECDVRSIFKTIGRRNPNTLERLSISGEDQFRPIELASLWSSKSSGQLQHISTHTLEELSLRRVNLESFLVPLTLLFDLSTLKRLTLWECTGVEAFLEQFLTSHKQHEGFEHIAISMPSRDFENSANSFEQTLAHIVNTSDKLSSFHLSLPFLRGVDIIDFALKDVAVKPTLRTLTLHDSEFEMWGMGLSIDTILRLPELFPHLQQFGYSEDPLEHEEFLDTKLVCLS